MNKLQVLLIEADRDLTERLRVAFESCGVDFTSSLYGKEGFDVGAANKFDFIVVDLTLPDLEGERLLQSLQIVAVQARVVVIGDYNNLETALAAREVGVERYYANPIAADVLVADVLSMLDQPPQMQSLADDICSKVA